MRHDSGPVPGATLKGQPQNGQTVYDEHLIGYIPTRRLKQTRGKKKKKEKEISNGKVYLIGGVIFEIESI